MADKRDNEVHDGREPAGGTGDDFSRMYLLRYLTLRDAIISNCRDCIRDCGNDCLDMQGRPVENIKCSLQTVRMEFDIKVEGQSPHGGGADFTEDDDFLGPDFGDKKEVGLV